MTGFGAVWDQARLQRQRTAATRFRLNKFWSPGKMKSRFLATLGNDSFI